MTLYTRYRDYSQFQSDNPNTDLNGADLDTDFDRVKTAVDTLETNLSSVRRSDGALVNAIVTLDSLSNATLAAVSDWEPRGAWATATAYVVKDFVSKDGAYYVCLTAHTSGVFATDLTAVKWMLVSNLSSASSIVNTPAGAIAATTVQAAIDELDAEKQPLDALLTAVAALSMVADRYIYGTGSDTVALGTITAAGRAILDDANAAAQLVTLGAVPLAGGTMTGLLTLSGNPSSALHAVTKQYVDAIAGSVSASIVGGRLTLATGTPVTVTDQSAKTAVYYTPYISDLVPIYDGSTWAATVFTELTLNLDSDAGHTGYHQSGFNFDCFVYNDGGALRLATGPAWTNDSTRNEALAILNGRYVNASSITLRHGTGTSDTDTVAANLATYVGTFRCTANGQTEDTYRKRFVWNMQNRVWRTQNATETTDTWSYSTGTIRQARASTDNQVAFVRGLDEDTVASRVIAKKTNDNVGAADRVMIGLDSTTAMVDGCVILYTAQHVANQVTGVAAFWNGMPGVGYHYLTWLELGGGVGTTTWAGDGGAPTTNGSGISAEVWA